MISVAIVVQCGDPGSPLNGTQNVDKGYVYGGSVMFICDKDYTLQGTSKIYCRADKSWSASVPRCLGNYITILKYIIICRR